VASAAAAGAVAASGGDTREAASLAADETESVERGLKALPTPVQSPSETTAPCPVGQVLDPTTLECVLIPSAVGEQCEENKVFQNDECIIIPESCPGGQVLDLQSLQCVLEPATDGDESGGNDSDEGETEDSNN